MKKATIVLAGGWQLELAVTPQEAYALERGVRTGEGLCRGSDNEDKSVTIACAHVLGFSVEDVEEAKEEDCNS